MKKTIYIVEFKESKKARKLHRWEGYFSSLGRAITVFSKQVKEGYSNAVINFIRSATDNEKTLIEKGKSY